MPKRLAVARFWFEGNAFSPRPTTLETFCAREWTSGREALAAARGTETELAAVAAFAEAHPDWEVTVLRCCSANPGGPIEDSAFAAIRDEIVAGLLNRKCDAVYLSLHGAAITVSEPAPDLALARAVREAVGSAVPIGVSFDLHANLGASMARVLTLASGYRTYPHVDMRETAARVLHLLVRTVAGEIAPRLTIRPVGVALPSFNMRTAHDPMSELLANARAREAGPVLDISLFGGFPYADTPDAGASVMVVADGDAQRDTAADLASLVRARAGEFAPRLMSADQGLRRALQAPAGLVAVTDPADNPLSGGAADTPALFRTLLALCPTVSTVFAFFADAGVVEAAHRAGEGATLALTLGGKTGSAFGPGVPVEARVLRLTQACFRNAGPMEHGVAVDMGASAVLVVSGIVVIVTSRVGPANDPAFFSAHGIDLDATRLLVVKAKNHFRAAFEARCAAIIDVDCPGPASADLRSLPFRHLRP